MKSFVKIVLLLMTVTQLACGPQKKEIGVEWVSLSDYWENEVKAGEMISFMKIGYIGERRVVLYNTQGIYVFEKQEKECVLSTSLSLAPFDLYGDHVYSRGFVFSEEAVRIFLETRESREEQVVLNYNYYYGDEAVTEELCPLSDWKDNASPEYATALEIQNINMFLEEENRHVFGNNAIHYEGGIGFLILDSNCMDDFTEYLKYGEYRDDELFVYSLNYGLEK